MTHSSEQTTANGMVPVLRPAVKHFRNSCREVGRQPSARAAALVDPEGDGLAKRLAAIASRTAAMGIAAE